MFEMTIRYREGKEIKEITGTNLPADGPFNSFWVIDVGEEEHFCVNRHVVVSVKCVVPEPFIIPIEQIIAGAEMSAVQFKQQIQQMRQPPDSDFP
jgi:hypothetical protein